MKFAIDLFSKKLPSGSNQLLKMSKNFRQNFGDSLKTVALGAILRSWIFCVL
jgi:hypothetical protein